MFSVNTFVLSLVLGGAADPLPINPISRATLDETLKTWSFTEGTDGWTAEHHCTVSAEEGLLVIQASEEDPYLHCRVDLPGGDLVLQFKARSTGSGGGSIFWMTRQSPRRGNDKARHFGLTHDGRWHDYEVPFHAPGDLIDLRIDPGADEGRFEIESIRLIRRELHPLEIEQVEVLENSVRFTVRNHHSATLDLAAAGREFTVKGESTVQIERPIPRAAAVEAITLELQSEGLPPVRRTVFVYEPELATDPMVRPVGDFSLEMARSGTFARLSRDGRPVAVLAPVVHRDGEIPDLRLVNEGPSLRWEGQGIAVTMATAGDEFRVVIASDRPCEGPVVRALGGLEQGLFAGLEYLGKGEHSSTTLDIETSEHLRFAPDPLKVTMPLMAFVTDRASVAITWNDMQLQPVYATPNFFDGSPDHRMTLRGTRMEATIRLASDPLTESVAWAVKKHGLPPLPEPPRDLRQQWDLCLAALNGPLKTDQGWGHCVEERWPRRWYADVASTVWRLTGEVPELPDLVAGGSHIRNDSIYFVSGRANQWLQGRGQQVRHTITQQKPDGSFRYSGKYARGHFEDTASGVCARPAATLLDYAHVTGDREALEAGVKALEFIKRFRTPRGAQTWEVPLHTPDQLASAYLVWAYVRGYELTGDEQYLAEARRWALSGVPFVYLWSKYPIMAYATPPVYGATNWRAPVWIGLPVQWVGIVYGYALTMLAPYDDTLDWNHLARGILLAGEQMQYPVGTFQGLLPDVFSLPDQQRRPANINPCQLVSLRMALDGRLDALAVAADGSHRVAAPFPVTIRDGRAHVEGRYAVKYQVLIDGQRVVAVESDGEDVVSLE